MSNKHIAEWVAALRSGNYVQGQDYLNKEFAGRKSFCCLGVGCDLLVKQHPDKWRWSKQQDLTPGEYVYAIVAPNGAERSGGLPVEASDWLGMTNTDDSNDAENDYGVLPFKDRDGQPVDLVILNDQCKLNFLQIADVINYAWGGSQDGNVEA